MTVRHADLGDIGWAIPRLLAGAGEDLALDADAFIGWERELLAPRSPARPPARLSTADERIRDGELLAALADFLAGDPKRPSARRLQAAWVFNSAAPTAC